jgi:sulfite reductase alpha subunit-like flavoprotein
MGKDVKDTIEKIVASEGRLSKKQASTYIQKLRTEKRLQTDLY